MTASRFVSERLLARLRADKRVPHLPPETYLIRLHHSPAQRTQGAWSWSVWCDSSTEPGSAGRVALIPVVGSQWTMTQCERAPALTITTDRHGDTHVDPDPIPEART